MRHGACKLAFAFVAAALLAFRPAFAQDDVSFQGKTITMIIGSETGGGTDATGRAIATFLHKYLPGSPSVIVQNMPGAGGVVAVNYVVKRTQPDGLTVLMGSESNIDPMVYRSFSNVQYDPKTIPIVGGVNRGGTIIFIKSDAQSRLLDKSKPPLVIGNVGETPREAIQPAIWGIQYLGWNAKWVNGYTGTNEIMLAFDRGEVDMTSTGNLFQIADRIKSGRVKVLNQTGTLRGGKTVGNPQFGNAPLFPDQMAGKIKDPVAQKAFDYWAALNSSDKWLGLAPGTPAPIVQAYRDAFDKASADQDFLALGNKISEGFTPVSGQDFGALVKTLADTPPEALEYVKNMMRNQGIHVL